MVKFRGIEICIISQFDICKLPEFKYPAPPHPSDPFQDSRDENSSPIPYPTASSFVPIYPGSQIWFEYTVDGPHPQGAAYFFKMYVNGKTITAWDCTAKHGFHGKMMYNLVNEGTDPYTGQSVVRRQALRFGDGLEEGERSGRDEDLIQVNVHRIEHRQRIRELEDRLGLVNINSAKADGLRLTNSGLLEPGVVPRRYKYQLLDALDMPYAAFRFHLRPYEYLEEKGIVRLRVNSPSSSASTEDSESSSDRFLPGFAGTAHSKHHEMARPQSHETTTGPALHLVGGDESTGLEVTQSGIRASESATTIPLSDSDDSLSVRTKDSLEDLPSTVSRSPSKNRSEERCGIESGISASPSRSPGSARQRLKKKLTLSINGADFDIDKRKRPLSPFTSGGVLRKACVPQTAPAAITEFGPTVEEEVRSRLHKHKPELEIKVDRSGHRTTAAERSGKKLMGFLGRRIGQDKVACKAH